MTNYRAATQESLSRTLADLLAARVARAAACDGDDRFIQDSWTATEREALTTICAGCDIALECQRHAEATPLPDRAGWWAGRGYVNRIPTLIEKENDMTVYGQEDDKGRRQLLTPEQAAEQERNRDPLARLIHKKLGIPFPDDDDAETPPPAEAPLALNGDGIENALRAKLGAPRTNR